MAVKTLKSELSCSVCLDIYTCPVMLGCGHTFCRVCIQEVIKQQTKYRNESCPECRRTCTPEDLHRVNFNLGNIAEYYKSLQDGHSTKKVPCTYCIQFPGSAVRTCLHCEASFCKNHLEVHCKSKEHVLVDPITSLQSKKCRIHNEFLKYFCVTDQVCICKSCYMLGEHQGHQIELLEKASLIKKEQLKKVLESLKLQRKGFKGRADALRSILKQNTKKVVRLKRNVEAMHRSFRECIIDAHVNVVNEVGRHLGDVSKQISDKISYVENRAAELSEDLRRVQTACNKRDPLFVLRDKVSSAIYEKRFASEPNVDHKLTSPAQDMDKLLISLISQKSIEGVSDRLPLLLSSKLVHLKYKVNILLNEATASNYLTVSADHKTVKYSKEKLFHEPRPEQFKTSQVLSAKSFNSGKHFWEVRTSRSGVKAIGVAYATIERSGLKAFLGYNKKSWCLIWGHDQVEVCHNSDCKQIASRDSTIYAVGVFLDYEAGRLSFYRLCSPVEHLHTIAARFTEPLHAAFYVVDSWIKINPPA
ncbi:E3 ubiquitin/ISG15 ligase TRIM25-like [Eleutherodactylus coqui]|uniref:E3 ubiquitin/ISG15 ligase TRIM25-like n=1 Tax=Eleutherodactylus coqui TaxID=57060 RepID=UPI003462E57E